MTTFLIVHGVGGGPQENWFPWLKKELEKSGHEVIVPQFPTPKQQILSEWLKVLEKYKEKINKDAILIGHSLGVPFILNVLEKKQVKAVFLVAGFFGKAGNDFDEGMKTFAQRKFDWKAIKAHCRSFFVFHSDNDSYIRLEKAEELAKQLKTKVILVKGAGHFNKTSGYLTFSLLLKNIEEFLK